jgi:CheY-like chemotaxis protein
MVEAATATKALLIVEDNDVEREGLATILRHHGYSTREAISSGQALELVRAARPALILLDMLLSGAGDDGWKLLDKLRRHSEWQAIPVLIVTGMSIACHEWAVALGAQAVVLKPINTDELLQRIEQYCL